MVITNKTYNTRELFESVIKLIKSRLIEKQLELKIDIADDVPTHLFGDNLSIKKILTNLLTNAVKYTDTGYVKFTANSINDGNCCKLAITIEDTGKGIKTEDIDKIFNKFERLNVEKNSTIVGTGLGLAISKRLVELMNGTITVESIYGSGSKFTINIDQKIIKPEIKTIVAENKDYEKAIDLSNKKILIVDDNILNIKIAERLLKKYNPTIDTAKSGKECIAKIKANIKYDLIFMDDMMPEMSGVETLKKLKKISGFNIPTIMLTANAVAGAKEEYLSEGFTGYIAKPIQIKILEEHLTKYQ